MSSLGQRAIATQIEGQERVKAVVIRMYQRLGWHIIDNVNLGWVDVIAIWPLGIHFIRCRPPKLDESLRLIEVQMLTIGVALKHGAMPMLAYEIEMGEKAGYIICEFMRKPQNDCYEERKR